MESIAAHKATHCVILFLQNIQNMYIQREESGVAVAGRMGMGVPFGRMKAPWDQKDVVIAHHKRMKCHEILHFKCFTLSHVNLTSI